MASSVRGKPGLPPGIAGGVGRAVGLAEGPQCGDQRRTQRRVRRGHLGGVVDHGAGDRRHLVGVERVERDTVACQRDCRLDQLAPRQLAELAMRVLQAPHDAGDSGRARPEPAVERRRALRVEVHVAGGRGRRHLAVVDGGARAVRQPDHHEPAAADVAGGGMGDAERERDGDGGIHGVPAALQDGDTDVTGVGLGAGDGALPARRDALIAIGRRRAADGGRGHEPHDPAGHQQDTQETPSQHQPPLAVIVPRSRHSGSRERSRLSLDAPTRYWLWPAPGGRRRCRVSCTIVASSG